MLSIVRVTLAGTSCTRSACAVTSIMSLCGASLSRPCNHPDARDGAEMRICCQDSRIDSPGTAGDRDIRQRQRQPFAIQLPQGFRHVVPQLPVGRNADHGIPESLEASKNPTVSQPPSDLAAHDPTYRQVPSRRCESQRAERILTLAEHVDVETAVNENGTGVHT